MKNAEKLKKIIGVDSNIGVYWRVQEDKSLPKTSKSVWDDRSYSKGQVCFFANLSNALQDLAGDAVEPCTISIAEEIRRAGKTAVLVAADSVYENEDGPGAEVILWEPREITRFTLDKKTAKQFLKKINGGN